MELGDFSPSDILQTTYQRGLLRMELEENTVAPQESLVGHQECEQAYLDASVEHLDAEKGLVAATGQHYIEETASGLRRTSWFYRELAGPNGRTIPVAHQVELYTATELDRLDGRTPQTVVVVTYPLHESTYTDYANSSGAVHLFGLMEGKFFFKSDALGASMAKEQTVQASFKDLKDEAVAGLTDVALEEILTPWATELVKQPGVSTRISDGAKTRSLSIHDVLDREHVFGLSKEQLHSTPLLELLAKKVDDQTEALNVLKEVFSNGSISHMSNVLAQPVGTLQKELERYELSERYEWVMSNVAEMKRTVEEGVYQGVQFGFRTTFLALLEGEKAKTAEISALAKSLTEDATLINDCAPLSRSK